MQIICQESIYRSGLSRSGPGRQKSGKMQQFVRKLSFCAHRNRNLWRLWSSSHQANQTDWQKIQEATGEKLSTFYLMQSISVAIQKGNAVCVRGCPKKSSPGLENLFNFHVQEAEML